MKRRYFLRLLLVCLIGHTHALMAQSGSSSKKIKVACVGNSITYGFGIKNRDSMCYPVQLQRLMGDQYEVRNFGVSGRTLLKKGDHPYWKEEAFRQVQQWNPDIVVIMLGTNDTKPWNWKYGSEFAKDYSAFLEVFKHLPSQPEVWAALPVPVFKKNRYEIRDSIIRVEIPIIRKVAHQEKVHLMNLNRALRPYGQYFHDGVHPDATGAHYLADAVYKQLSTYTRKKTINK